MRWSAILIFFVVLPVFAQQQENSPGHRDTARGKGIGQVQMLGTTDNEAEFSFNAESDPVGNYPKGVAEIRLSNGLWYKGIVVCLRVTSDSDQNGAGPKTASLVADIVQSNQPFPRPDAIVLAMYDNGDTGDLFSGVIFRDAEILKDQCSLGLPPVVLTRGEIVIYDE